MCVSANNGHVEDAFYVSLSSILCACGLVRFRHKHHVLGLGKDDVLILQMANKC